MLLHHLQRYPGARRSAPRDGLIGRSRPSTVAGRPLVHSRVLSTASVDRPSRGASRCSTGAAPPGCWDRFIMSTGGRPGRSCCDQRLPRRPGSGPRTAGQRSRSWGWFAAASLVEGCCSSPAVPRPAARARPRTGGRDRVEHGASRTSRARFIGTPRAHSTALDFGRGHAQPGRARVAEPAVRRQPRPAQRCRLPAAAAPGCGDPAAGRRGGH